MANGADITDLLFPRETPKCLICYCHLTPTNSLQFNRVLDTSQQVHNSRLSKMPRLTTRKILGKQLHVIFILKNVLELPSTQLEKYLRHAGDPENWIKLCDNCNEEMEQIKGMYKELQRLSAKFEEAKWQIQEKISATSTKAAVAEGMEPPPKISKPLGPKSKTKDDDPLWEGSGGGGKGRSGGRRKGSKLTVSFQEGDIHIPSQIRKEFDIVESCRHIVSQRSDKPPPLTLSSNPFFYNDKKAHNLAGRPDFDEEPIPLEHLSPASSTTKSSSETEKECQENVTMLAEPEPEMAVLFKYEVETETNQLDLDIMDTDEPDFAYADGEPNNSDTTITDGELITGEPEHNNHDDHNNTNCNTFTFDELQAVGVSSVPEEFKESVPCPLCITHRLEYARMGPACRHLQSCLDNYQGRMRYFICPICKKWKCKVKEVRSFGEHLQLCRDGQGYMDSIPLEQRIYSCSLCKDQEFQYLQYSEFLKHLYRYHQHSYGCTKCPCRFETLRDCTVAHWKLKHSESMATFPGLLRFKMDPPELPEIPWSCPMCFKKFPHEALRDKHLDICPEMEDQLQPDRSFKCDVKTCGKEYFWEEEVKIHDVIAHAKPQHHHKREEKTYFCDQCNKYFLTEDRMKTHSVTLSLSNWLYTVTKKFNLLAN